MLATVLENRLARIAYEAAYVADAGGKNWQGEQCPAWPDLPEDTRRHWRVAVQRVAAELEDIPF